MRQCSLHCLLVGIVLLLTACGPAGSDASSTWEGAGSPVAVSANGGWSWWQGPLVEVSKSGRQAWIGAVASGGEGGQAGSQSVSTIDLQGRTSSTETIGTGLRVDDHNAPAVIELPDGSGLALWTGHRSENIIHRSTRAAGSMKWVEQSPIDRPEGPNGKVTYSNLIHIPSRGESGSDRIFDFYRGPEQDPAVMWSDDSGDSWTYGGRLFDTNGVRPYMRYAAGPEGRIHFVATNGHPHDVEGNSLWSGYLDGEKLFRSDGTFVATLDTPDLTPSQFTPVWSGRSRNDANIQRSDADGWTSDLVVGPDGYPVVTFSERRAFRSGPKPLRGQFSHQAWYAHFDGDTWQTNPVAELGGELYEDQPDYTGLTALDPTNPDSLVISTDIDPRTGDPTSTNSDVSKRELFEGSTSDRGETWKWRPVTERSPADNIRPRIGANESGSSVLAWLRGDYPNFLDYDLSVMALVRR